MDHPARRLLAALLLVGALLAPATSAVAQVLRPDPPAIVGAVDGYWMLDRDGWVYAFGGAPDLGNPSADLGGNEAVALAPHPDAAGYWVLASDGSIYAYGSATHLGGGLDPGTSLPGERAATLSVTPSGRGYWIFTDRGRALAYGDATHHGDLVELGLGASLNGPIVDSVALFDGSGYYMVGSDGGVFAFGSARFAGSMGSTPLNAPVNGLAPDRDGSGYRLVASDGGVFAFDATFRGSMGSTPLNAPVVGMIGYGDGYLMVASDGGIFNFSGRAFVGSFGGSPLPAPIVGVAGLPASITGSPWLLPVEQTVGDAVIDGGEDVLAPVAFSRRSTEAGTFPAPPAHRDQTLAVTGDLDGDGIDDIVIGGRRGRGEALVWFRRTADTWERRTIEPASLRIEAGGTLGDIDGDGDLDLIAGEDTTGDELWWWENPAPANPDRWVRRVVKRGSGNQHHDQLLADLDGDGRLELAFWNQNDANALRIAEIPADPTVEPWPSGVVFRGADTSEGLTVGDIDGDGRDDLVGGGYWFSARNGVYTANEIDREMSATRVVVGQFVEGGRPEVVFDSGDTTGRLRLYGWDGSAWVGRDLLAEDSVQGHSLGVGDVNLDGHLDLLAGEMGLDDADHPQVRVLYGDGAGGFAHQIVSSGVGVHEAKLADVDGDGDLDIVGKPLRPDDPSITVWINEGGRPGPLGGWHRHVIDDAVGHRTVFVEHADLDGDGDQDLLTGAWWWRNPGTIGGRWDRQTIGADLRQVYVVADLDDDGDIDVLGGDAAGSGFDGDLRWAENDGSGSFVVRDNIERADGALLQGAVVVELTPGVVSIALSFNDGVGGLQLVTLPAVAQRSTATWTVAQVAADVAGEELAAGDIDRDGDTDLFDGEAWFRNDAGRLTRVPVVTVGAGEPDRVALDDIDGDGDLDAVVSFGHDGTGRIRWYAQGADPSAPWTERVIADLGATSALSLDVGDLDGDGDPDVVVGEHTNPSTDGLRTIVYENLGGSFLERVIEAGDEHHDGTQLVDLDGDGDLDVASIGWLHRRLVVIEHVG